MAMALTAWLMAPAPIAWTSTRPLLRMTPAMAPATATGLEVAETFSTSTGARSADIVAGTPSNMFTVGLLDGVGGAKRVVERIQEDATDEVHDQRLGAVDLDDSPASARRVRWVVGRAEDALQARQLAHELLLRKHMVAGRDHVGAVSL